MKNENQERRMAIRAIKENTPKEVEPELLNLIDNGYEPQDLHNAGYSRYLSK